ncbi:MAG: carbamate kinase [Atopobiaceae bacterium]|nr:carbamate kinase [Atopobiaceae bacterium]
MNQHRRIVISLGGLALGDEVGQQIERVRQIAPALLDVIQAEDEVIITHGNGPQVHTIQRAFAVASTSDEKVPVIDLPECGAMSQGYIGYHLQQALAAEMHKRVYRGHVATVVTQIEVDADDPSFDHPTKEIGPRLTKEQAESLAQQDPTFKFVRSGTGYRRVVASPRPRKVVEYESILNLLDNDFIVIACGGGGIPVVRDTDDYGCYTGVPAIIEKDWAAEFLGDNCDADLFVFLTNVDCVYLGFGTRGQQPVGDLTVRQARAYADAGEFGTDSMEPKVRAAIRFCEERPDRECIIGSIARAADVVAGRSGTRIHY